MTRALVLYPDGEVRDLDLDPDRLDVIHGIVQTAEIATFDMHDLDVRVLYDGVGLDGTRRLNLAATTLAYGYLRRSSRPVHPFRGPVILLGYADGIGGDVPAGLVGMFSELEVEG